MMNAIILYIGTQYKKIALPDKSAIELMPPHFWHRVPTADPITAQDMRDFAAKANFAQRSVSMFYLITTPAFAGRIPNDVLNSGVKYLHDQQSIRPRIPIRYPPATKHLKARLNHRRRNLDLNRDLRSIGRHGWMPDFLHLSS